MINRVGRFAAFCTGLAVCAALNVAWPVIQRIA